ncbi:MAG TPA: hypothetical protein VIK52_01220 [Opitutaceae bacterium]
MCTSNIEITVRGGMLAVKSPYRQAAVDRMRVVAGRRWDAGSMANLFPVATFDTLAAIIADCYADCSVQGPGGEVKAGEPITRGVLAVPAPTPVAPFAAAMTEEEAIRAGHAESKIVEVFGKPVIVRIHASTCPCECCMRPAELHDFGDWIFVVERERKLAPQTFIPLMDRHTCPELDGTLIRATWTDNVVEKLEVLYGKEGVTWVTK